MTIPYEMTAPGLPVWEIVIRVVAAMLVGAIIGLEREYTKRPAGMRTHMLVALGACAVMVTSQLLFSQYRELGATLDPARLSAQVIAGVGFLGAGTIIREGATVKGLTTAASIWTVACIGLAVGAGYYILAGIGSVAVIVTLIAFEWVQRKLMKNRSVDCFFRVQCRDLSVLLKRVNGLSDVLKAGICELQAKSMDDGRTELSFQAEFFGKNAEENLQKMLMELSDLAGTAVSMEQHNL